MFLRNFRIPRWLAILLFVLLSGTAAFAQQPSAARSDLERRRQAIIESIRQSQQQLEETKRNKNATLAELRALQSKLDGRMRLIGNINQEIAAISGTIQTSTQQVGQLQQNLTVLKSRYAQSVRYAYKHRSSNNMLAFLFSSKDYNDAVRRMKYLKRYRDYRQQQAEAIRTTQGRIESKIDVLNTQKKQKDMLLTAEEQQKLVLQQERNETNTVVTQLKGREKELLADIANNKKAADKVKKAVNALIAREIEEQRRRAMEEARKKAAEEQRRRDEEQRKIAAANAAKAAAAARNSGATNVATGSGTRPSIGPPKPNSEGPVNPANSNTSSSSGTRPVAATIAPRPARIATAREMSMTPEALALSNSFAANRGRLPWPVERGVITGFFGTHKHPVANVMVDNNGIDIQTGGGAAARAVFEGTVTSVFPVDGSGLNVLVAHGEFYTVYANLASVSVSKGQHVSTKQTIGTVGNNEEGLPMINFQIWKAAGKGSAKLNPSQWIAN